MRVWPAHLHRKKAYMKLNPLNATLVAAGVLAMGAAGAFSLKPLWPGKQEVSTEAPAATAPTAVAAATPATTAAAAMAPVAPIPAQTVVPNYRAIFAQAGPAVVGVTVSGVHKLSAEEQAQMGGLPPGFENDPFFQFFRGIPGMPGAGPNARGRGGVPQQPFRGQGSGFIISADGLILTNAHVVREAKEVTVKLSDRREFSAKVLGADPTTDIAVLRIPAKDLPTVRLGNPKQLEVGDPVMAIGAPFGFEQTATQGIVSAKGRSLPGDSVVPFIQTDAAVNPGNSGGPLFDGSGNVVGINAQIYSQSGGYQGLAFAIPIDVALKVKDQIVATGKATHGRLGVAVQDVNQSLAESFGMKRPDGALVASVARNSAAAKAGIKPGDVIVEVNGEPIVRSGSLSSTIGMAAPGDKVKLKVWRDKAPIEIEARLGGVDDNKESVASGDPSERGASLGLALRPLTRDERRQIESDGGLVVQDVTGPAARAGIEPGDVLVAINGKPVTSIEQVRAVMASKPKSVALLVERDGERIFVPVNLG
jgi:serine protease Do